MSESLAFRTLSATFSTNWSRFLLGAIGFIVAVGAFGFAGTTAASAYGSGSISAGGLHNCAVKSSGTPVCWGYDGTGQTDIPAGIGTVDQVSAGGDHSCAVKTDGIPVCWGSNDYGQAAIPAGIGTVTQISAGGLHTCTVKTDGTPVCWGYGGNGQTDTTGIGTVTQISAGGNHTCAVKTDGSPVCWGYNGQGQTNIPAGIGTVTQVSAGYLQSCAVKADRTPVCWGDNGYGQSDTAGIGTVTEISAADYHTCAVKTNGTPVCWGADFWGQQSIPAGTGTVTQISAGTDHSCAIKSDGIPVCWGRDGFGQKTIPAGIGTLPRLQVSGGAFHSCAVRSNGTPICWGDNSFGQTAIPAGTGTVSAIGAGGLHTCAVRTDGTPVCWGYGDQGQTTVPAGTGTVIDISAGRYHTCAIKTDGTAACWGWFGSLAPPGGLGAVSRIESGDFHSCAIKTDGTPACWGNNGQGETDIPAGIGTVTQISAGANHTCAVRTDGTPICWGSNSDGQTTIPAGIGTVSRIATGRAHTCAIKSDGTLACWGDGAYGQMDVPAGIETLTEISAGQDHTCAIEGDGTPTCWGATSDAIPASLTDAIAPTTTDDVPAGYANAVTVTLSASDTGGSGLDKTYYTKGASPPDPTTASAVYDSAAKPTLANGEKIKYFSTDNAGNAETVKTSGVAQVDSAAPTTTDDVPAGYANHAVTVTLNPTDTGGSGLDKTYYTKGASPPDPTTASAVYDSAAKPTLANGEKIKYFSTDTAGNAETVKTSGVAQVDSAAPTTTDDVPAGYVNHAVTVSLSASDTGGSGLDKTYYETGSNPATPTTASPVYDPAGKPTLGDGERIKYFSTDNAGNAEASKTSGPPKLTKSPSLSTSASGDVTLGGSVRDTATIAGGSAPGGQLTFKLYGPDDATCTGSPVFSDTVAVSGAGLYPSASFTPARAGTYRFVAEYSGDQANNPLAGGCDDPGQSVMVSAETMHRLGVHIPTAAAGMVDSGPAGIDCGPAPHNACSQDYVEGSSVTLTAHPGPGATFIRFIGGGCSGTGPTCTVAMGAAQTVEARFAPVVGDLSLDPDRFVALGTRTPHGPATPKGSGGTRIRFVLGAPSMVHFAIRPLSHNAKQAGGAHSFNRRFDAGEQSVAYTGTLGTHTLAPGRYRLLARAIDESTRYRSERASARFRVVAGR